MRQWKEPGVPFRHRGFTLMEMMIVVVIVGVLA
jgi:prepilin-type N-terminal cleavage/methylation domain-containing protein